MTPEVFLSFWNLYSINVHKENWQDKWEESALCLLGLYHRIIECLRLEGTLKIILFEPSAMAYLWGKSIGNAPSLKGQFL